MRRAVDMLLGGAAIYVVMSACSDEAQRARTMSATSGAGGHGGTGGATSGVGGVCGRAEDAFPDPVRDAAAETVPAVTQVDDVPCAIVPTYDGAIQPLFATKAYPGASMSDLSRVSALGQLVPNPNALTPAGYSYQQTLAWVRDGSVTVWCGFSNGPSLSSVRFVRTL